MESWANGNLMKLGKDKCRLLHMGRNDCSHQYRVLRSSPIKKDLGVLVPASYLRDSSVPAAS